MSLSDALTDIQKWYAAQCDGDWEHSFGISISTLDNPGWSVSIDLEGTILEDKKFERVRDGLDDGVPQKTWINCEVRTHNHDVIAFIGQGDPSRLEQILQTFLKWAQTETNWLDVPQKATVGELDKQYWEQLPLNDSHLPCSQLGCSRNRISFAVFCRKH